MINCRTSCSKSCIWIRYCFSNYKGSLQHFNFYKFWYNIIVDTSRIEKWINSSKWSKFFCIKFNISRSYERRNININYSVTNRNIVDCVNFSCASASSCLSSSSNNWGINNCLISNSLSTTRGSSSCPISLPRVPIYRTKTCLRIKISGF